VFTGSAGTSALIVEETVAVSSNTGTLAHVPLYITSVQVTAGGTTGAYRVIPTGETPLTAQCAVTFTTGVLTFLAADGVTTAKVTYIPKRSSGYLSAVTVDEVVTASASKVNLAARAGLIQYVWDDTDGKIAILEPSGEAPTATNNYVIDINDSGNTSIDCHADDASNSLKVTYVPFTQLPPGTFIDDTDVTLSSQVWNFTGDPGVNGYNHTVVPGFGCVLVGEETATNCEAVWEGPSGTAANNVAVWNPAQNKITTAQTGTMTTTAISWMILDPNQLTPNYPAGTNAAEASHTHSATGISSPTTGSDGTGATGGEAAHTHAATGISSPTSGGESTHTHAATGISSPTSGAGASHTHSYGNLTDTASGSASVGEIALNEVDNGVDVGTIVLRILAIGV
jgi:hypothetical protein